MSNIVLSKHEIVVDREFVEDVFELAFGDDAINKGYTYDEVLVQLKEFSDKALHGHPCDPTKGNHPCDPF